MSGRFRRVKKDGDRQTGYKKPEHDKTALERAKSNLESKALQQAKTNERNEELDVMLGFERHSDGPDRTGFMFNMRVSSIRDEETGADCSCLEFYFVQEDGKTFKGTFLFQPYFLISIKGNSTQIQEVETYLNRRFEGLISEVEMISKIDLDVPNHLSGSKSHFMKVKFRNVQDLMAVRKILLPRIQANKAARESHETYGDEDTSKTTNVMDTLVDIREYDVPYVTRVTIDTGYRVGLWYDVQAVPGSVGINLVERKDLEQRPLMKTMAFDIETTKLPLKFPSADIDQIMMISYMLDGQGYLIVNREIVSEDIEDFEYTPKPEYPGEFIVFNETDELALLHRFFEHIRETSPLIYVTYNGDFFDWPFIDKRAAHHGMDLMKEIGVSVDSNGEYAGLAAVHLDAFCWVKRDSYLPQGSQGLKAVTKAKLKYNPLELDPEDMVPFASEKPQVLASYSVSDAVATYYLYYKYIHLFIFSLATIIPMPPSDVLRKGSGTLCELLLMVKAYEGGIICPDKQKKELTKFHKGHLLESETYIGGHVECLESGVFRHDLPYKFRINPDRINWLLERLDNTLHFAIEEEGRGTTLDDIVNYDEVKQEITDMLVALRDKPNIETLPMVYHLDVGAMYPNIILTNRLQPMAIVDQSTCAACDFNRPGKQCQRAMKWSWRGKYFPASRSEYERIKAQLEVETVKDDQSDQPKGGDWRGGGQNWRRKPVENFLDLPESEQASRIQQRLKTYSNKVYKKQTIEEVEEKEAIICQRENPFYVNTVRAFRDRRYDYKALTKKWNTNLAEAVTALDKEKAKDMVLLYDSMQLAHKCILNSFYGYVMRTGARWQSIEMAGVVTHTGANIIRDARMLVEDIGRPLELDTDGIWCILPRTFPDNFVFKTKKSEAGQGRPLTISYPCNILNYGVKENYSNHQYQMLVDEKKKSYNITSECSILFEVDGPYAAMVLPASRDEGKNIKKRYAVFNKDGSLAELKGFEIKRRGELKLIKLFQGQVFKSFLGGKTLEECYSIVGGVANHWLEILYNRGGDLEDEDVFDLISENKNMSQALGDYGAARSTSITTAKRLGQFLGNEMVKDKGLTCRFIISSKPVGASVSDRAIPVAIFSAEEAVKKHYLRKWTKDSSLNDFDVRSLLDWDYYVGRLANAVQKIVTIPAAFQKVKNPCPTVAHPDWLHKKLRARDGSHKQTKLGKFFEPKNMDDIEDIGASPMKKGALGESLVARVKSKGPRTITISEDAENVDQNAVMDDDDDDDDHDGDTIMSLPSKKKNILAPEKEEEEDLGDCPDKATDFNGWLNYQKKVWKRLRKRRRAARERVKAMKLAQAEDELVGAPKATLQNGLQSYFQQSGRAVRHNYWQIVQIVEEDPGRFRLWVLLDQSDLRQVTVTVPRVIYLNTRQPSDSFGKKVVKVLPRGRPVYNLYQVEMSEAEFLEHNKELSNFLNHSEVEGVYESKLPLILKLVMEVGCVCKVSTKVLNRNATEFEMSQLTYKTTTECPYLSAPLTKIFLFHSKTEGRGVFGVFIEGESEVMVVVVNPFPGQVENVNLRSLLRLCSRAEELDMPELQFIVRQVATNEAAFRLVRDRLAAHRSASAAPSVVVAQCPETLDSLYGSLPILKSDFPVVRIASNGVDNMYPAMNWYTHAARRMLTRYLQSGQWWTDQVKLCRYAHVPIGNLAGDYPAYVSDVLYARSLRQHNHLLWVSSSPSPDLGGRPEDESRLFGDEHINPQVMTPGCYRDICIELDISHMAINTVVKSNLIEELEGGMGMHSNEANAEGEQLGVQHSSYACQDAFNTLKSCVTNWLTDALRGGSVEADNLLQHFYRWLRSPSSQLYDPMLHQMVHKMMKKVFRQLLQRFRKLGSTIVYANFTKLIISTRKPTFARGIAYCKYVLETIKMRPLFQWLEMSPSLMWENLMFLDDANWGGILTKGQTEDDEDSQEQEEPDTHKPDLISHWNLAEYLPEIAKEYFQVIIAEMCTLPYEYRKKMLALEEQMEDNARSPEDRQLEFTKYLKDLVGTHISRKMFKITKDIDTHLNGDGAVAEFPRLAGSHLAFENPALEFAKTVTHILALDKNVEQEVTTLKTSLMKMLMVRPFSDKAMFQSPCLTFTLPDVICSYCNQCRDLDLCRDPDVSQRQWSCTTCHQPYDLRLIESSLVDIVMRRSTAYQVQDLVCKKCRKVKMSNMQQYCSCSGDFETEISPQKFDESLRSFANIAKFHQFEWLAETVAWVRSQNGGAQNVGAQKQAW